MKPFTYERAADAKAAVKAVAENPGAKFLAGGTNLLDLMKLEIERPTHLVDVGRLPFAGIEATAEGGLRIGGAMTNAKLAAHPKVRELYPVLARAIRIYFARRAAPAAGDATRPARRLSTRRR